MTITCYSPAPVPFDERARAAAVVTSGILDEALRPALQAYVERARALSGTRMAAITAVHGERQHLLAAVGLAVGRTSRAASFCAHTILEASGAMCVADTRLDPRFAENPAVLDEPFVRFYAGASLRSASGHALGALCVFDQSPRGGLQPWEAKQLLTLADQAMGHVARNADRGGGQAAPRSPGSFDATGASLSAGLAAASEG